MYLGRRVLIFSSSGDRVGRAPGAAGSSFSETHYTIPHTAHYPVLLSGGDRNGGFRGVNQHTLLRPFGAAGRPAPKPGRSPPPEEKTGILRAQGRLSTICRLSPNN